MHTKKQASNKQAMMSSDLSTEEMLAKLKEADERASAAEERAGAAEERAGAAEERAGAAEERVRIVEESPEKVVMLKEIKGMHARAKAGIKGQKLYHANQEETATEVVASIRGCDIVFNMVIAPCQAGKTGCMLAIIENVLKTESSVKAKNIFVITGLSDTAWREQTEKRLPFMRNNVIHRGGFRKSTDMDILKGLNDAIILIDECQIACKEDMSLDKLFKDAGLKDLTYLKDNNVNIVEFSATPNRSLNDTERWFDSSKIYVMKPGEGYVGHSALVKEDRLRQASDLFIMNDPDEAGMSNELKVARDKVIKPALDAIRTVKLLIDERYKEGAKFHIIRTPSGAKADTVIGRFREICGSGYAYTKCYAGEEKLVNELAKFPDKHTFIFIKESARCAVTFDNKDRIGIMYERLPKSPKDDVIVQGLAGRACGYPTSPKDDIIVFTNIPSINRYVTMIESDFNNREGFTYTGVNNNTWIHPISFKHNNNCSTDPVEAPATTNMEVMVYSTYEELRDVAKSLDRVKSGPNQKKPKEGDQLITASIRGVKRPYTLEEVRGEKRWGFGPKIIYRYHVCYEDINDITTIKHALIVRATAAAAIRIRNSKS